MHSTWCESVDDLARHVEAGDRVSVGGVHFMRAPVALLRAVAARGTATDLTYVAWGGGLSLEILLASGLVRRSEMCFSSMDVFGLAPHFRRAAEDGTLDVVDHSALGLINGLRARSENLAWDVLQHPAGSHVAEGRGELVESDGIPMVKVDPIDVDVMLLHAQRADDAGNVEITGAKATDISTALAARKVLVTVEERVAVGGLDASRAFVLPRSHVTAVTLVPYGAFPTSCLPYYAAHYPTLSKTVGASAAELDALLAPPKPDLRDEAAGLAAWRPANRALLLKRQAPAGDPDAPATIDETMTLLIAGSVNDDSVCSFGSASLLPAAAYLFAKATHAPGALLMSLNGGYLDIGPRPVSLSFAEAMDYHSAVAHTGGDETYHWYYQSGRVTHEVVGAAQIDARGSTNNLWIDKAGGGRVRLPGQGGMADVANLHRDFVIYLPRMTPRNTVPLVQSVSARREWFSPDRREAYNLPPGKVEFITDRGVMAPDPSTGLLQLTALQPGVTVEAFRAACGFEIEVHPDLRCIGDPDREQLRVLRDEIDPLGVRTLDFVASSDRARLIDSILSREGAARAADPIAPVAWSTLQMSAVATAGGLT